MTLGIIFGGLLGLAVFLLAMALVPPRTSLAADLQRFQRGRTRAIALAASTEGTGFQARLGQWVTTVFARYGINFSKQKANLELVGQSFEEFMIDKALLALFGFVLPALLTFLLRALGVGMPFSLAFSAGLLIGIGLFFLPDLSLASKATARRKDFRRVLSCYLDLVAMSLAGGRGAAQALPTAARIGHGWAFELIQNTLDRARLTGTTSWEAFSDMGARTGMTELQTLGSALSLVGEDGAKIRESLTARAATERKRQLAEAEGASENANQKIQMAQIILAAGFFLLIGFPAVMNVMTA